VLAHPYKVCPTYIIPHWAEFVKKVKGYMGEPKKARWYVQVGAFADKGNAEAYLQKVKKDYPGAFIKEIEPPVV
ncbi:MAG: SPOR domain-containing protein, partial [Oscillospiraceae bacterium]|nr:SPOR domain-containing protein [Oscillospiraceae bacterium]